MDAALHSVSGENGTWELNITTWDGSLSSATHDFPSLPISIETHEENRSDRGGSGLRMKLMAEEENYSMIHAKESLFEVYCARCPRCGTWEVWDVANPRFVNGPRLPFGSCCPVCGNLFRVNAFDSGFVTCATRDRGFSTVRPASQE
jgi:hypothetical protein